MILKGIFFSRIEMDRLLRLLPAKPQISEYRTAEFRRKVSPIRARTAIFVIRDPVPITGGTAKGVSRGTGAGDHRTGQDPGPE
jgi:hypothetical protein